MAVWLLEAKQRLYPNQQTTTSSPTVHDGSTHPSYDSANSLTLQAMNARGMHERVIVNDAQSVINDTTDLSKGLQVINDTTDMSEGLSVINNTSAKIAVVVNDPYGLWLV